MTSGWFGFTWIVGSSPTMTFLGMARGKERKCPLGLIPPQFCSRVKLGQNLLLLPQGEKFFCFGEDVFVEGFRF